MFNIARVVDMVILLDKGILKSTINENALNEIENFIFEYNLKHTGTQVTAEKSMTETDETSAAKSNTFAYKNCQDSLDIPKPTAYILNPLESAASAKFVHEFQEKMSTYGIVLNVIPDCDVSKLGTDVFLIFVCIHIPRLKTDVDNCLRFISSKQYDKTILVILHIDTYKDQQSNSERFLIRRCPQKYASIFQIIDMSFRYGSRIYPCEMNTKAFRQIQKTYDSHKKTVAMKTKSKGNEPGIDNTENRSNQQLKESQAEVISENKIKTNENEDLPEIVETESQLLVDFINFHEFNGIFL